MKTLDDVEVKGQVVLVRVDYNVPLVQDEAGEWQVASDLRIRASLGTIRELQERGAKKIILMSHLGRPKGRDEALSLAPVVGRLAMLMGEGEEGVAGSMGMGVSMGDVSSSAGVPVQGMGVSGAALVVAGVPVVEFVDQITGEEVKQAVAGLLEGGILVLENLRFDAREEANDVGFAQEIVESTGATLFVEDGFAATHRAHASTSAIAKILPAVAGRLVEKEVKTLRGAMENPERPMVAIVGGAKVEDKAPLVEKLAGVADRILVGGKIAADMSTAELAGNGENATQGGDAPVTGLVEGVQAASSEEGTTGVQAASSERGLVDLRLAGDNIYIAEDFDEDATGAKLDIGPVATGRMIEEIAQAKTVLWNGVLGKVEDTAFATGSEMVAKYLGEHPEITSIICGGDTTGFVEGLMEMNPELKYTLVSTGGGAALTLLTGGEMPGLEVLE